MKIQRLSIIAAIGEGIAAIQEVWVSVA